MIEPKHQSLFALAGLKVAYAVAVVAALGAGVAEGDDGHDAPTPQLDGVPALAERALHACRKQVDAVGHGCTLQSSAAH